MILGRLINVCLNMHFQVLAAVAVSMGSMIIGFSSAYTSTALDSMNMTNISSRNNHTLEVSKEQVRDPLLKYSCYLVVE